MLSAFHLSVVSFPLVVTAALYSHPADVPQTSYDFIVVGAGVGGGVVARRLSEDPGTRTLLIEAGPSNEGILPVEVPLLCTSLSPDTAYDWNYTTTPQRGLDDRVLGYPRGRLLGGSSSINYLAWTRGSRDDYDRLARVSGDAGWAWDALTPFMKSIENFAPGAVDGHNISGQVDRSLHGTSGPLTISMPMDLPTDRFVIGTTQQLKEFPFVEDMNSGNPIGIGYGQNTIKNGTRDSSATAYILPALASNLTLDVLVNSQVLRVLQTGSVDGVPIFRGVQFAASANGTVFTINATREVILSAGSVATPQLLLLSGIGNSTRLKQTGIRPIVNLPDVGQNMQDHPLLGNIFNVHTSNITTDDIRRNNTVASEELAQWQTSRTGLLTLPPSAQIGWFRVPDKSGIFAGGDPSAGPTSPHFEFIVADGFAATQQAFPSTGRFFTLVTVVVSPKSRGAVTLASSDPFANPVVDPNFFSAPVDIAIMREAVKAARRFVSAPVWKGYIESEFGPFGSAHTDAEIEDYVRNFTITVFHPAGTAAMAPFNATHGVVNPDLTVKGTVGLRVVDASIFPFIPAAHTQAPTYIIAERAASLIRNSTGTAPANANATAPCEGNTTAAVSGASSLADSSV
ncbi:GMC oxidoreductase [Auriscalpium vulgare]|uniref:GMC oxidoreductase n=1 Tax=Auriscalpium vulgare TaxID=40419 RepID=A0ACB8R741_9AGAM|nr:GMC oxidoreductase [Auriscalpium vulgare]